MLTIQQEARLTIPQSNNIMAEGGSNQLVHQSVDKPIPGRDAQVPVDVTSRSAQEPLRIRGQTTCPNHLDNEIQYLCQDCNQLACVKCVTSVHQSHTLDDFERKVIPKKELEIKCFIDEDKQTLEKLKAEIDSANIKNEWIASHFAECHQEIEENSKAIAILISKQLEKKQQDLKQVQDENNAKLMKYIEGLICKQSEIGNRIEEYERTLKTGSNIQKYELDMDPNTGAPVTKPLLTNFGFVPTPQDKASTLLEEASGQLTETSKTQGDEIDKIPKLTFCSETKILQEFDVQDVNFKVCNICPVSDEMSWVSCVKSSAVTQVNHAGTILKQVMFDGQVNGICVSPSTGLLWACSSFECSIYNVTSGGRPCPLFMSNTIPWSLCVTQADTVVVGMTGKVKSYTADGKELFSQTIGDAQKATKISECPLTHNLAILTCHLQKDQASFILIVKENLEELFHFQPVLGTRNVVPTDVRYDTMGKLVVAIAGRNQLLYLDDIGKFIKLLYSFQQKFNREAAIGPYLGIDKENTLWAVFYHDHQHACRVQQLKYCRPKKQECSIS
ncbi:uncharacterized protein LOC110445826 [Mizuhopecten yessoensis]|uniref:uncharacterized protein LOC110445826 n=1 Tax=Mizuhopecten yessoensis TaxID=6573 RepID=UPI000B457CCE|nr:uncharacterized protein LOC110445826 [Mizuhopecten yessoensis]